MAITLPRPAFTPGWRSLLSYIKQNPIKCSLFLASVVLYLLDPGIDLEVSGWFYRQQQGFFLSDNPVVRAVYLVFARIHFLYLLLLLVFLLMPARWLLQRSRITKKHLRFLLMLLLLGPGLLVNLALKEHSLGRARPVQVTEFAGDKAFSTPFQVAQQCRHNCSFVSGHAAAGFYLISLAWVLGSPLWLVLGSVIGFIVGLGRVLQGGHFLSDILFCFWLMYFLISLMGHWYGLTLQREPIRITNDRLGSEG